MGQLQMAILGHRFVATTRPSELRGSLYLFEEGKC